MHRRLNSGKRDEAKQEAKVARLAAVATSEAKGRAKDDLTKARDALAAAEEDGRKLEAEVTRLVVDQTSLLLELKAFKDEVSSLHSHVGKDKEAMEEDYQEALEHIFVYGYECCALKHNIRGDRPRILDGMADFANPLPLEFFANLGYPQPQQLLKPRLRRCI